jgi:DNA-binding transcriptional MerR regulator
VNEKDIKEEYYLMSIHDYRKGTPLSKLKKILKLYEQTEMYEQCAGIHKAIQEIEMRELIKITKLIRNKNGRSNNKI